MKVPNSCKIQVLHRHISNSCFHQLMEKIAWVKSNVKQSFRVNYLMKQDSPQIRNPGGNPAFF
ncbi:hypothetical protein D1BOALGB6SA_3255 [Olavius sp. associated proteobacterium Delta 1]|nr:hypothetical protein D1BOALGB6SA_3255 [Olavius sp. associated proteobacterium Delta 1]